MKYEKIYFDGVLNCGAFVHNAMVEIPEDATMHQIVEAIKDNEYIMFKLQSMNKLVKI